MGADKVRINHADGLHECETGNRANEAKALFLELAGHELGLVALFRNIFHHGGVEVLRRLVGPDELRQPAFLAQSDGRLGVINRGADFGFVADNGGVAKQTLHVCFAELGDLIRIEVAKGCTESLALLEHHRPGQAGLERLETQTLVKSSFIENGQAPFGVVILLQHRRGHRPRRAAQAIIVIDQGGALFGLRSWFAHGVLLFLLCVVSIETARAAVFFSFPRRRANFPGVWV